MSAAKREPPERALPQELQGSLQEMEAKLLLTLLQSAFLAVRGAAVAEDRQTKTQLLTRAVDVYVSVKGLLPKQQLPVELHAAVNARLEELQELLAGPW